MAEPIKRLSNVFTDDEFNLFQELSLEYLENFLTYSIWLYRIDVSNSSPKKNWNEAYDNEIAFLDPIELNCYFSIEPKEIKEYNDTNELSFEETGNMTVYFYTKTLTKSKVNISIGDILAYQVNENQFVYFKVFDNDSKNYDAMKTFGGYKSFYRVIECAPVSDQLLSFV